MRSVPAYGLYLLLVTLVYSCERNVDLHSIDLSGSWEFTSKDTLEQMPATVPGVVHLDLFDNGLIDDPFYRDNEASLQWIDKQDWVYTRVFSVPKKWLKHKRVEIEFEGLDTYAIVRLNGDTILTTDNMFRTWKVDCKEALRPGENDLEVIFPSIARIGEKLYDESPYFIPASPNDNSQLGGLGNKKISPFIRKAGYHFGWDWGPRFLTSGIWRSPELRAWSKAVIRNAYVRTDSITPTHAYLTLECTIESEDFSPKLLRVDLGGKKHSSISFTSSSEQSTVQIPLVIADPDLWWPNGMGEQSMYEFSITLLENESLLDVRNGKFGIRQIDLVSEPDEHGASFYFEVNGRPVFMKGANYIPCDNFPSRVSEEHYRSILTSAADANMNMLRVWGGGIYEDDIFYDLCDELGLLVWQDFMFACSMYPGDSAFIDNVRKEAIDNVTRIRTHPCIALWCGNNEVEVAWKHWGWKNRFDPRNYDAYQELFQKVLPEVVQIYDPDTDYWSSSPSSDSESISPRSIRHGDLHYWQYRRDRDTIAVFAEKENIPRFMSETGFQAFPSIATLEKYMQEEDLSLNSPVIELRQKSRFGNDLLMEYILRHYQPPKDFKSFVYLSQLMQSKIMKLANDSYRKAMPYCMGTLYWQLNDCWPGISWSGLDYLGRWKALQYEVRNSFSDLLLTVEEKDKNCQITLHSLLDSTISGNLEISIGCFNGAQVYHSEHEVHLEGSKNRLDLIQHLSFLNAIDRGNMFLRVKLRGQDTLLAEAAHFFVPEKDLQLVKPDIRVSMSRTGEGYLVTLVSSTLVKDVEIGFDGEYSRISDNYFDLFPSEEKKVLIRTTTEVSNPLERLKLYHLLNSYSNE